MLNTERKTKFIGFRVGFELYIQTIEAAQKAGVSVSDFILALLIPKLNNRNGQAASESNESSNLKAVSKTNKNENSEDISLRLLLESEEKLNNFNKTYPNGKYDQTRMAIS